MKRVTVYPSHNQFHVRNLEVDPWFLEGPSDEDLDRRWAAKPGSIYLFTKDDAELDLEIVIGEDDDGGGADAVEVPLTVDEHGAVTFETVECGEYPHVPVPPGDYIVRFSHTSNREAASDREGALTFEQFVAAERQKGRLVFKPVS